MHVESAATPPAAACWPKWIGKSIGKRAGPAIASGIASAEDSAAEQATAATMLGVRGPSLRCRSSGHELCADTDVLRFEVLDLNRVITTAAANADLYRSVQDRQGHPRHWQMLPLCCFAVTPE